MPTGVPKIGKPTAEWEELGRVRKVRPVDPRCDVCGEKTGNVRQFGLQVSVKKKDGSGHTRRGAGSIRLCETCWKDIAEPRRYARRGPIPRP